MSSDRPDDRWQAPPPPPSSGDGGTDPGWTDRPASGSEPPGGGSASSGPPAYPGGGGWGEQGAGWGGAGADQGPGWGGAGADQGPGWGPAPHEQSNGPAIAALICGILSLPLLFVLIGPLVGIAAIVLGIVGLRRAGALGGKGRGMAITGLVTGAASLFLAVILAVFFVGLFGELIEDPEFRDELERQMEEMEGG